MTLRALFMAFFLAGGVVQAAEPQDPVVTLMKVADGIEGNSEATDYYDEVLLTSIYSRSFARIYRMAALGDDLLDLQGVMTGQDEVVVSQDPCPMRDLKIVAGKPKEDVVPVAVYFDVSSCWGNKPDMAQPALSFHVIKEDGRYVIDNFWNSDYQDGRLETSVKVKYADLAKSEIDHMLKGFDGEE
ncbi:hypothetical protein HFC70_09300 [Agrobacterium sp. a22-2]|uniref:hypothetical protein n=1 Tax=Agrobacterium sp. a22-2 TaxID=2283840 RepID=UPI001445C93B|nr:hypothetical protein [Agrobacterium sp. a22-2]NKN36552.1 hypothetical protein [Agrobacterium sp. a22-2]